MHDIGDIGHTFANRSTHDLRRDIKRPENVAFPRATVASSSGPHYDPPRGREIKRAAAISAEWAQRVGGYANLPMLMRGFGLEPATMLDSVHLPQGALEDEDAWVPYACLGTLLVKCVYETGCAHFGLLAGRVSRLAQLGAVGDCVRNSALIGDALKALTDH